MTKAEQILEDTMNKHEYRMADTLFNNELAMVLDAINTALNLPVVIKWVAIADKQQPEVCTEVLVRFKDGGTKCRFFDGDGRYYNTEQDMDITDYITHWAALPE